MENQKEKLLDFLKSEGYLNSPGILSAFENVDRKDFLPEELQSLAYKNVSLQKDGEEIIFQPALAALIIGILDINPGEKILEIGVGNGWLVGLLAHIACGKFFESQGESMGQVIGIEKSGEWEKKARENLANIGFSENEIKIIKGDGIKGYKKESPYDKIISSVAIKEIPDDWKNQLKIGGRILCPQKDRIVVLEKTSKEDFEKREYFGFEFEEAL